MRGAIGGRGDATCHVAASHLVDFEDNRQHLQSEWAQRQHGNVIVFAQGPSTPALGSIAADRHLALHHLHTFFNKVHISTLWPLALARLKISAHRQGVQ